LVRAVYRTRQVIQALRPRIDAADLSLVRDLLDERQRQLFETMERRDQRHAIEVARRLMSAGAAPEDLLVAALLHDCGKGEVPVWLRVAYVLAPRLVAQAACAPASGWRGAAYRLVNHAQIGAEHASEAGVSPRAAALVRGVR
jgi:hypothetical protein